MHVLYSKKQLFEWNWLTRSLVVRAVEWFIRFSSSVYWFVWFCQLSVCILYACLFHMSSVCTSLRHEHFVNPAITINLSFSNCFIHHVD